VKARRLSSFIDALLRNRRPREFKADPEDAQAVRSAIELRAAEPGADEPTDEFVRDLQQRLQERVGPSAVPSAATAPGERAAQRDGARTLSRRRLLEGAGIAASAVVIGAVADHLIEGRPELQRGPQGVMVPDRGQWVTVASADRVASTRVTPFLTSDVAGFVVNENGALRGLSAICTHQGCVLHANMAAGRLDCPCHRAAFALDGKALFHEFAEALKPLPTLRVRRSGNSVQVLLPPRQTV
jgi:cytochrome b6-f complex iron-sulfur subunit